MAQSGFCSSGMFGDMVQSCTEVGDPGLRIDTRPAPLCKKARGQISFHCSKALSGFTINAGYNYGATTQANYQVPGKDVFGEFSAIRTGLDFEYHGNYSKKRQLLQDVLISDVIGAGSVAKDGQRPWLIFTAGAMGSGKGHVINWLCQEKLFPLPDVVQIDPDEFRSALPEWPKYLSIDKSTAGQQTHREVGYIAEIATAAALQRRKNVWVDGSLRDGEWYSGYFKRLREQHPDYHIAILHVYASEELVLQRARSRAEKTGREVPVAELQDSLRRTPASVERLSVLSDFVAHIRNEGPTPVLERTTQWGKDEDKAIWESISSRFVRHEEVEKCVGTECADTRLQKLLQEADVVVFSKTYCSYCKKLRAMLDSLGVMPKYVQLDNEPDGEMVALLMHLDQKTGHRTVPQVFVRGEFVGTFDECRQQKESGALQQKLQGVKPYDPGRDEQAAACGEKG